MADDPTQPGLQYAGLGAFLGAQDAEEVRLTMAELEALIHPNILPPEAGKRQFWANTTAHHGTRRSQWLGAGYRAFLEPTQGQVRFVRAVAKDATWTEAELRGCVAAYRLLLSAQQADPRQKVVKAELRRKVLADSLRGRSEVAYEYRMQNITAVLRDLGMDVVEGYVAARNIGRAKPVIVGLINEIWGRDLQPEAATSDPVALETRVIAARAKLADGADLLPPIGSPGGVRAVTSTSRFVRDPNVIAWVLKAAGGQCEVCDQPAPFRRADGEPYLEVHHVRWMAQGGPDTVDNTVAGCPNCHRRLHHAVDREALRRAVVRKVTRIVDHPKRKDIVGSGEA